MHVLVCSQVNRALCFFKRVKKSSRCNCLFKNCGGIWEMPYRTDFKQSQTRTMLTTHHTSFGAVWSSHGSKSVRSHHVQNRHHVWRSHVLHGQQNCTLIYFQREKKILGVHKQLSSMNQVKHTATIAEVCTHTQHNPADIATRSIPADHLKETM